MGQIRPNSELASVLSTAKRLGIGARTLRSAVRQGQLPAYRPGQRTVYVKWSDVLRWVDGQRLPTSSHARDRAAEIVRAEQHHRSDGKELGPARERPVKPPIPGAGNCENPQETGEI